jgi:hypothetical protein
VGGKSDVILDDSSSHLWYDVDWRFARRIWRIDRRPSSEEAILVVSFASGFAIA